MSRSAEPRRRFNSSTSSCSNSSPDTMKRTMSLGEQDIESPGINVYGPEASLDYVEKKGSSDHCVNSSVSSWLSFPGSRTLTRPESSLSLDGDDSISNFGFELRPLGDIVLEETSHSSIDVNEDSFDLAKDVLMPQCPVDTPRPKRLHRLRESLKPKSLDIEKYAAARMMSKTQERWNAITMLPPSLYCIYFIFCSNLWIKSDLMAQAQDDFAADPDNFSTVPDTGIAGILNGWFGNSDGCLDAKFFPPALPPLAVLGLVIGTILHLPFSFIYHWTYAHSLEGTSRVNHWSRKMDQSMIHFASALYSFGASGSMEYFFACALFNFDCARRHFLPHFRPRSNQVRIGISILAYSLPILRRGDLDRFAIFWFIVAVSMWLFSQYPIGGWSHVAFHLTIACVLPLLLSIAIDLPGSQPQLKLAAQCAVLRQNS